MKMLLSTPKAKTQRLFMIRRTMAIRPRTIGDPATTGPVNASVHGSSSTADEVANGVVIEQRRSGRNKRTSPAKEKLLEEEARRAADDSPSDIDGTDDEDENVTSSKQLPVIKKLKKQGRTIKPVNTQ